MKSLREEIESTLLNYYNCGMKMKSPVGKNINRWEAIDAILKAIEERLPEYQMIMGGDQSKASEYDGGYNQALTDTRRNLGMEG